MKMIFLALIVQCCINFASVQAFVITRAGHGRDAFKIPASICKRNGAQSGSDCKSFYALDRARDCSCMCPAKNATFAYHDRRWSCVENRKLRRDLTQDCDVITSFVVENADRRLPTLAFGARREISLWFVFWPYWTCTLNIRSSWYLGCRGSKIYFRRSYNAAVRLFTLSRRNSDAPYVLRVNNNIPGTNIFRGKAINLVINCRVSQATQRVQFDSSCLLFKLEGNTTCPVSNTTITSSSTIHRMQASSLVPSTPRITASHLFTQASKPLAIKPTISNLVLNTSNSYSIFSRVSTYLGSQPNITEISPILGSATKSAITPVTSTIQLIVSEISATQPSISDMSLIAPTTQATISEVSPVEPNTQKPRSEISPTTSEVLSMASEVLAPVPGTQQTVSNVSPTEPDTTPTDSETSETPPKDPGTSQTPRILLPKTLDSNQTALKSNVPPTLSQDRERSIGKESSSVGLIALLPITLIIIAAIIVSLVYRRRYSRKKARSRSDTISETTMDTLVMNPQMHQAIPPDHDRTSCNTLESKYPYSLNVSSFEIPEYDAPLSQINLSLEDEDTPCRWYAPANIVKCHPRNTQAPFDYVLENPGTNKNPPTDHTPEDNGQEENNNDKNNEPMYYVLEGPYPEGVDGDGQSSAISSDRLEEEPTYCTVRELFRGSPTKPNSEVSNSSNDDPKCQDEPIYNVLERRYFQGSKVPAHYLPTSPKGPIFGSMKRPSSASTNQDNVPKDADEPVYDVLDRRYFGGSKVPAHYVHIALNGPMFSSSDVPYFDPSKNRNDGPKCADEPVEKLLEERYLDGSQVPVHYVRVSPNGLVFSTLDKVYLNSRKVPNCDPKCESKPEGDNIVEERYLEGSEIPEHYVQISANRVAFSTLEFRNARKGSNYDRKCGTEPEVNSRDRPSFNKGSKCGGDEPNDSIVEERYLEGSEVPKHYVKITPNGPVFSTLEKVHRNPSKESKYDPKCGTESEGSIVEEHYLAGSELHENYVEITQNSPVFNILEKLYRDSVKAFKLDPKCEHEGVEGEGNIVEERYLKGSEVPSHYVQITAKDPVFNMLENLYRNSLRGSKYHPERRETGSIVEERYLEGSEVPKHYVQITSNGPGFRRQEKLHSSSCKESKSDPEFGNESEDKIVEERYLEGSEVPKHYVEITPNGPVFNILEKLYRDSVKESRHDADCANESMDKNLEERYLEGSEVPEHYVTITPKGLVFCTLERSHCNSQKDSKCDPDPKCSNESEGNIVEERYLAGSELPSHYEPITPKDPVFNVLEKMYRDSVRGSKYDPEHEADPGDTIVEERYLEGSEVPKHYVQITPNGLVFNTLEWLHRNSRQGSKCDRENGNESEDSIVEGRYLEGSEVPKQYVEIAPNGPVFNILEKLYRDSVRKTKHDPEHGSESEGNIVEERYLTGSEVPKHYVRITSNGLFFSTLERSHRNSHEGSKCDPQRESELKGSITEERSLADSGVPKHHAQVTSKDPVLNILKRLYRNSRRKGIKRDPKRRKNPESDSAEEASKETTS